MICDVICDVCEYRLNDSFVWQNIRAFGLKPKDVFLVQGTLRPDLIESASNIVSGNADVIKTHHNDTRMLPLSMSTLFL